MIAILRKLIDAWASGRHLRRSRHRKALAGIPPGLYAYWAKTAGAEFKGIPASRLFFTRAAEGLMDFFECVRRAGAPCALPSNAADSVWHAWSRFSRPGLDNFCVRHFGRAIPHIDGAALGEGKDAALAGCLVLARRSESLPAPGTRLPRLFKLDAQLRMPGGFAYRVAGEQIAWHRLDQYGKPHGTLFQVAALAPLALLNAGLVTQAEYLDYQRRSEAANVNDSGGGGTSSGYDWDGDSGSDGGSDGGSSCGGGCGGGD